MDGSSLTDALRGAVDGLLHAPLSGLSGIELAGLLEELETQRRRLAALDHRVIEQLGRSGAEGGFGATSVPDLLVRRLRITPGEARQRCAQAAELQPQLTLTGQPVPPLLPATSAAARGGEIGPAHVAVISRTMDRIPHSLPVEACEVIEAMLVEAARHEHPKALERTASMVLERIDPDGREAAETEQRRRRTLSLSRRGGAIRPDGELTEECFAVWTAILDSLAAPRTEDGVPDERSPGQRRHDALLEAGLRLLRSGTLPHDGGVPVTVLLHLTAEDLQQPHGTATGRDGTPWPVQRLRPMLGDTAVLPVVFDHDGAVLACGRGQRLATPTQRLALAARDLGCCFPGCTRPPGWCQAHHVREWQDHGPTDIDNLCLLCDHHHRTFAGNGWAVIMTRGVPEWRPPSWLDPQQCLVRNTARRPPELDFGEIDIPATARLDVDVGATESS